MDYWYHLLLSFLRNMIWTCAFSKAILNQRTQLKEIINVLIKSLNHCLFEIINVLNIKKPNTNKWNKTNPNKTNKQTQQPINIRVWTLSIQKWESSESEVTYIVRAINMVREYLVMFQFCVLLQEVLLDHHLYIPGRNKDYMESFLRQRNYV